MDNEKEERLGAVMDHARRIEAAAAEEKAIKAMQKEEQAMQKKDRSIQISFNSAELARLKDEAAANGLNLQDYIRKILSTYG